MKKKPLVSIIIPIKNSNYQLKACLNSIKKQSYKPIEIIINDSKRKPSYRNKQLSLIFNNPELKTTYLEENKSMAQARHEGMLHSKGNYILHIDADMTLSENVVLDLVSHTPTFDALIIPEKSIGKGFWAKCRSLERSCYIGDDIIESARFFKRDVYEKIGYHDNKLVFSEDKDLDLRIRQAGYKIGRINSLIYHHEGKIRLINHFKKKLFYGQSAGIYIKKHPLFALMEANVIFRPAFFRHWKYLAKHPMLTIGIFILKIIELTAVTFGIIYHIIIRLKSYLRNIF